MMESETLVDRISSPPISEFIHRLKLGKVWLDGFKSNLLSLDAILDDAELKAYENKLVKTWVDRLSEVSYDAKGLLDEISKKPRYNETLLRVNNSAELEEIRKQRLIAIAAKIKDLQTQGDALGLREDSQIIWEPFQLSVGREDFEDEFQVIGRDEDKEAILKLLLTDDDHHSHVITMVGEGGVGKTTLAQLVYNDKKVVKQFEFKAWIHVSEDFDDLLLTKAILQSFTYWPWWPWSDIEDLDSFHNILKDHLNDMKFLLVLDNLTMRYDWRNLQKVLIAGANGSRIIVTTCHPQLQETMGTLPAFTVRSLTMEESWMIFAKHAFPDIVYHLHPQLEDIGKEIVEKCRGLPLAAKMLASVMRFKPVEEWHAVLNNNSILKWDEDPLSSILKMCYNDLPTHLKRCADYCSIFPTYHEYEEDKLILLWMAQGFLQQKEGATMEEEGREYFRNLTDRSFFQPSGANKSCFIMPDLLKDVIHSESGFICSRMRNDEYSEVSSKPWHLLISGGKDIAERSKEAKFLRTLIVCKSSWEKESCQLSGEQLNNLFEALQCVRVLSLSGYDIIKLPDSIGKLERLRFLDLSHTAITQLSDSVSSLYNLQTLLLSNCSRLTGLPDSLHNLRNLQFLDLSHTKITNLPASVFCLYNLQTLLLSNCYCLTELTDLFRELRNLQFLDLSHTKITKLPASVRYLDKLQKLLLSHCTRLTELPDSFHNLRNLQFLDLSHTEITELPASVKYLDKLQKLLLSYCSRLSELPNSFYCLRNLQFLDLSHATITRLPESVSYLSNLQTLLLSFCPYVTILPQNMGKLINLRHLDSTGTFLEEMPGDMGRLTNLRDLSNFVVGKDSGSNINELGGLSNLRGTLRISQLQYVVSAADAYEANLKNKADLKRLVLRWSNARVGLQNDRNVLEQLEPHKNLERLSIQSYGGTRFPYWLGDSSFSKMVFLQLMNCNSCSHLPPLGQLPSLKELDIEGMNEVKRVGPEFYGTNSSSGKPFPSLELLAFRKMLEWEQWTSPEVEGEEFPLLKHVSISKCPKLKKLPLLRVPIKYGSQLHDCNEMQFRSNDKLAGVPTQIDAEESLEDIETSKSPPPESPKHLTEDSSAKHGGASAATEVSSDTDTDDPIDAEESLEVIETSKSPPPESPKHLTEDSSAKHGGASAATEISSDTDTDTDDPIDAEESLEDISSPEQESLDVSEISQLKRLPPKLYSLKIEGCDALKSLHGKLMHDNPYLQHLYIIDCHFLESIHESHLPIALKTLYISKSKKLELEFLSSEYTSIEHLCIESSCDSLESFPLASFPNLRNLSIRDCANFTSISSGLKDHMSPLDALEIRDCPKLISFPERGLRIPNLTSILLSNCKNLKELPGQLYGLKSLQSLFMKECPELESIPGGLPSSLNLLCISSCHKLTPCADWKLHMLNSFSCIEIEGGCTELESFPEKNLLPMNLTSLRISRLMNLKFLDYNGLEHLTSLETLKINSCGKLQSFPAEGLPSSLSYLYISDCPLLKSKLQNRRGKEWYKIDHIPHIQIDMEVIS